jgi:hypothetical protein
MAVIKVTTGGFLQPFQQNQARLSLLAPSVLMPAIMALFGLLSACSNPPTSKLPTAMSSEYLPTAIALTLEARGVKMITPTSLLLTPSIVTLPASFIPLNTSTQPNTDTPSPTLTKTPFVTSPLPLSTLPLLTINSLTSPTSTPFPTIPDARIQILGIGDLSLITSPIEITTRLSSRVGKVARIDLYGEDGRLLARYLRVFTTIPWTKAVFSTQLTFEVRAAAEVGRLVVSVEDSFGRIIDVNSVNLILLSQGITELTPPTALSAKIVILDPQPKTLIQGGTLYVSGLVLPGSDQTLKVVLLDPQGRLLGQRIASITQPDPAIYGTFFAEVRYSVSDLTNALLVAYESGGIISEYYQLSSVEVILSP